MKYRIDIRKREGFLIAHIEDQSSEPPVQTAIREAGEDLALLLSKASTSILEREREKVARAGKED